MQEGQTIQPLNTEWNRKANVLEGTGKVQILDTKNGITYFTWTDVERGTVYLQCEENFFLKHFRIHAKPVAVETEPPKEEVKVDLKKFKFKKYPFDLISR